MLAGLVLATIAYDVIQGPRDFSRLTAATDTADRQKVYAKWTWQSLEIYGVGSLAALWLIGRLDAIGTMPAEFTAILGTASTPSNDFLLGVILSAMLFGLMVPTVASVVKHRRARAKGETAPAPVTLGNFEALMPRNVAERRWALWISIVAGVCEELFHRLLVPLLLCTLFGNAWVAFGVAALLFGVAHAYQGWAGMAGCAVVALVFSAIYLASGQLWLAMAVHAFIDLNTLLLGPAVRRMASGAAR